MVTVRSGDTEYNSGLIGNGEVVTMIGPTGFHNGFCPLEERVNRTIFWAGRRLSDARGADIHIPRVPPEEFIFRILLENKGAANVTIRFVVEYLFGDAEGRTAQGTRLHIRRPHPDDLGFGNVEGTRSRAEDLERRPPHPRESLSVHYEVERHLGEVRIGRHPNGRIRHTDSGGELTWELELPPGGSETLCVWVALSDRSRYFHFPQYEEVDELVQAHERSWREFWEASVLELGDAELESIRRSCL